MFKILILGGSGFIGKNLSLELESRGHKIFIADRLSSEQDNNIRCDIRYHRQLEYLFDQIGKVDYVFNLAAEYGRWNGEQYFENLWETNVIGLKNLIRLQEIHKFKMIFFSSAEVYGDYKGEMIEEVMIDNKISDTFQMNDYAISKWAGELICQNSIKNFGTETVIVRPVNCYGPYEHYTPYRGFIPKFIYHNLTKKPYTVYSGHKRIIDFVEDTCRTIANIIENFKPGEAYNIGSNQKWEYDIKEYSDMILNNLGLNDDSHINYEEIENNTTIIKSINFDKAITDLNHSPKIDPFEGIDRTIKWMKKYYDL